MSKLTSPLVSAEIDTHLKPEWVRLPAPRERCPITGLSRTTMTELVVPGPANDNIPPVKSVVIRKRGATRGIRLVNYDSLMGHLSNLGETP